MSWAVAPDGRYERFPVAKMARRVPGCPHWLDQSGVCILLALGTHTPELTFLISVSLVVGNDHVCRARRGVPGEIASVVGKGVHPARTGAETYGAKRTVGRRAADGVALYVSSQAAIRFVAGNGDQREAR